MVQIKKSEVRQAIVDAAYKFFAERGYSNTNIPHLAKAAGVSPANVYVYFQSKLDVLFSVYEPWLLGKIDELEKSLARSRSPAQCLKKLLTILWRDIPAADNGFANNLIQALSTTSVTEGYSPQLRITVERRLAGVIDRCLPELGTAKAAMLAQNVLMTFDGYVLNFHLNEQATCPRRTIAFFTDVVLAYSGSARGAGRRAAKGSAAAANNGARDDSRGAGASPLAPKHAPGSATRPAGGGERGKRSRRAAGAARA